MDLFDANAAGWRRNRLGPAISAARGRPSGGGVRILVSAPEPERLWYTAALRGVRGVDRVIFVAERDLTATAGRFEPALIVVSIRGLVGGMRAIYQLLDPELGRRRVVAAIQGFDADLDRVLRRLGVECCVIRPRDPSTLRDRIRRGVVGEQRQPASAVVDGSAATARVVAGVVRGADKAVSAHDVAASCGLSVVTARRYLKQFVVEGHAEVDVLHRAVGRPISMYRWSE
ncbi:hypothetical protein [Kutzneria sp. NPDC052558]|uniref:hypothetical protein n=1 Tax=Kutzneria sp. NPDC052558 TaxID=3364121 RepID=UPI0037C5ABF6